MVARAKTFEIVMSERAANRFLAAAGATGDSTTATRATVTGPNGEVSYVAVMAREEYETMAERLEDLEAAAAYDRTRNEEPLPAQMVDALLDGDSPMRVWRQQRGLTQKDLAGAIGKSNSYISEIETGKKDPSLKTLRAVAAALDCDLDDLV